MPASYHKAADVIGVLPADTIGGFMHVSYAPDGTV